MFFENTSQVLKDMYLFKITHRLCPGYCPHRRQRAGAGAGLHRRRHRKMLRRGTERKERLRRRPGYHLRRHRQGGLSG